MPSIACPSCGATPTGGTGGQGERARCPACGEAMATTPVVPAIPAHGPRGRPTRTEVRSRLPLSPALLELCESHRAAGMAPPQRVVFALLVRTFQAYRRDRFLVVFGFAMMPFFAVAGGIGGLLAIMASHLLLAVPARMAGVELGYLLYAIPLFLVAFALFNKWQERGREVTFHYERGEIDGLELGRLHEIFETSEPSTMGFFLGICFGAQVGLLRFTPDHAGLPLVGGWAECALLTLDNACHGIFLDTFELYDIRWGEEPVHSLYSATIFYAFRLAYDTFAALYVLGAYHRYRLRHLFRGFPHDHRRVFELLDWIEARCGDENRWPSRYFDEFLFLMLAKEYLRGNLSLVRQVSLQFYNIAVAADVRSAFIGPGGDAIFRGRMASRGRPAPKVKEGRSPLD